MGELKYDPISDGFFNVFLDVGPVEKENILHMPLGDIELPEGWYANDYGIPMKGTKKTEENEGGTMINDNNPEIEIEEEDESPKHKFSANESKRTEYAVKYFTSKGLKLHQAKGLVGNLLRESGLNPKALNKASGAMGIALWLGDRKTRLISKYGKNPTFLLLLDFVWEELNSTHRRGLDELLKSSTVEQAAANAFGWFEFSVGPQGAILDMINHNQDGRKSYNEGIRLAKSIRI